ncbi:MAG: tRNA (adenosine(37)-N6)-threonylcarbamoyltransferase complex transferase subunit TsaD [Elusimicrobia bacterium]|nr:tRNA (adenosine(37)-N6)-threonylcarbamoyltransferase complex transferase subunit TsaD [Elusimicrobiota bacterium]
MNILGIETSCDETSAAVVKDGRFILTNVVSSQIKIHKKYGGVVPELASRQHLENINVVIEEALRKIKKIDAVSVTKGPGLIGSLLIGTTTAQVVSDILKVPIVGVNHIEGHIFASFIKTDRHRKQESALVPPFIALVVSGGHTDLILVKDMGKYEILGRTRDDAVGEVFDKIAKFMKLGYPGGPIIDRLSKQGNPEKIKFPRPYMHDSWDFSFSGLKTAIINYIFANKIDIKKRNRQILDICASFQQACVDVLVKKTIMASVKYNIKKIVLGGGVSSNSQLRSTFVEKCKAENIKLFIPEIVLCTDNAAMIASAGYFKIKKCGCGEEIKPSANLELENW